MAKSASEGQLHAGHRKRLRMRFLKEGLGSFEDHQVLELLLFQAVPRLDTNPLAHKLIKRFGSLSAVLEADPKDLASVEGVGENAAAFLSMIPHITRRYFHDRVNHSRKPLIPLKPLLNILSFLWQDVLKKYSMSSALTPSFGSSVRNW